MKHRIILITLLLAGIYGHAAAKSVEVPHGGHHYHSSGHHANHYHPVYHYHPHYYSHNYVHFSFGNCENRYDRCVRRHPNHPSHCRACR